MNLDEAQRKTVAKWIAEGLKLSDIQTRLLSELGIKLTYMEVRLLVDDLKLTPKDPEPEVTVTPLNKGGETQSQAEARPSPESALPKRGGVSLTVDQLARPGALVSGKVTFGDGKKADWYLDQTGRLGLVPQQTGYRPPAADVQEFQAVLETELSKLGF